MPRRPALSAALPLLLLVCASASAQGSRERDLLSTREAPRRSCRVLHEPRTLPTVSQLGDSAGIATQLGDYLRQHPITGDSTPYVLYSVSVRDGQVQVRPIEYLLPEGGAQELTVLLRNAVDGSELPDGTFRLRADLGAETVLRVGRSERCPPEFETRFRIQSLAALTGSPPRPVRVRMMVGTDGRIMNVILLGTTGRPDYDRFLRENLLDRRIPPGIIDGQPMQMEHEQLIQFATRG